MNLARLSEPIAPDYPYAEIPAPGTALEIATGVYWLRMPLPWALDHINVWLLRDDEGWIVVDTGYGSEETRTLWEGIFDTVLGGEPIKAVIATHFHPDHVGLATWLVKRFGASFWMTATEYLTGHAILQNANHFSNDAIAALFRRHGLDEARLAEITNRNNNYARGVGELPASFMRLMEGDLLSIGSCAWRVIIGHGHAPEHATLYCEALGLLIAGDMVLPRISPNISVWPVEPEGDPLRLFLASLARFDELPARTLVLPSHGEVFKGLQPRLREIEDHHRRRLIDLLACCAKPQTAAETVPILFRRELDSYQWFFAMGEAIAHLNFLLAQKKLQRNEDGGVYRFVTMPATA